MATQLSGQTELQQATTAAFWGHFPAHTFSQRICNSGGPSASSGKEELPGTANARLRLRSAFPM